MNTLAPKIAKFSASTAAAGGGHAAAAVRTVDSVEGLRGRWAVRRARAEAGPRCAQKLR